MKKKILAIAVVVLLFGVAGCQGSDTEETADTAENTEEISQESEQEDSDVNMEKIDLEEDNSDSEDRGDADAAEETQIADTEEEEPAEATEEITGEVAEEGSGETEAVATEHRGLVVVDPGHQSQGDSDTEPNGPGSSEMKAKVLSGTSGMSTGKPEYQLNLEVSLKLRDELESRGYDVIMTRESNDVRISNAERAQIANDANADVFVRVHANGDDDPSVNGVVTICQTASNPYNASLYSECRQLSELVLDAVAASTGAQKDYVWETDTMTGINWANVPSTIVEMGFMTNAAEDERMADESYQYKIAEGIANGIDAYMDARG